ncbi:adenosine receptor A2a-like [Oculina patagonica]
MEDNSSWFVNNSDKNISGEHLSKLDYSELVLNYMIAICVIHAIICFTALFGNSALLITIWKTPSLHSATNILLASLAVSDFAVGLLVQPMFIGNMLSGEHTLFQLGDILGTLLTIVSFIIITAIAVDRLLALQLHLRYRAVVTPFRATWVVVSIWVFTGIFTSSCLWYSTLCDTVPSFVFLCLLAGNFGVYLKIYLIVRRHQRQIHHHPHHHQQQEESVIRRVLRLKKTVFNTFIVFILLLFCYLPYSIVFKMFLVGIRLWPGVYYTTTTLIFLNSSLNPLLYCWRDREIRTAV